VKHLILQRPATQYQKNLAREFVDAGALFVVGAHPHVVQEHETYRGVPIYYSLGNLVFDQYWDSAVQRGLTLLVSFDATGVVNIAEMPVFLQRDRQTCPRTNQNFAR
jgi:poly-gamma-glutamate synthesis protein (capsule biosynthesis protein)